MLSCTSMSEVGCKWRAHQGEDSPYAQFFSNLLKSVL